MNYLLILLIFLVLLQCLPHFGRFPSFLSFVAAPLAQRSATATIMVSVEHQKDCVVCR